MTEQSPPNKKLYVVFLVVLQLIYAVSLFAWFGLFLVSFMSFDAGVSFWNTLFVLGVGSYPLAVIVFAAVAWIKFSQHKYQPAALLNLIPMGYWILFIFFIGGQ